LGQVTNPTSSLASRASIISGSICDLHHPADSRDEGDIRFQPEFSMRMELSVKRTSAVTRPPSSCGGLAQGAFAIQAPRACHLRYPEPVASVYP
jgi:hypothetical protein